MWIKLFVLKWRFRCFVDSLLFVVPIVREKGGVDPHFVVYFLVSFIGLQSSC